jgi:NAD(P)-dependent dehydrogenase (short-subunit alcohol dehydrogenase family)
MGDFSGKVALITGGASGIGEAAARLFARQGAQVMIADIDGAGAAGVAKAIAGAGGEAAAFAADLTDPEAAPAMAAATVERFGGLDCAFNNVGGALPGAEAPLHTIDLALFEADLRLNFHAGFYCLRAEIPHLLRRGGGAIVNTSSLAGLGGTMSNASYTAGKHAIVGLTKNAAIAYGPAKIRVNAICPGSIDTPGLEANFAGVDNWRDLLAHAALARIGRPEEVAELVVWLCSERASFISGAAIPVDGGTSAFAVRVGSSRKSNA